MSKLTAVVLLATALSCSAAGSGRTTLSLNGNWDIAESVGPADIPRQFTHRGPVPGLTNLASPRFEDVDQFDSRAIINNRIRRKMLPESARIEGLGTTRQKRNYFWYRTTFRAPAHRQTAILKVNKAQFGTSVWLNGKPAGDHAGCFTAGFFDLSALMNWQGDNELMIRIGAHPAVLPASQPAGTDNEKLKWTPGIYDDVSVALSDNPVIETVQVAPRLATSQLEVQTAVRNHSAGTIRFTLTQSVDARRATQTISLQPGESRTVTQTVAMPAAHLWTPEDPFLYRLETSTGGDSVRTRFGMREFRFDTPTRRAYLNGKPYFLRGSNITLHRFFEDPQAGALPWDEKWVRRLLVELPKKMHWNTFRLCIGPVPDKWLDIADEAGLLIQQEYFIWTGPSDWHKKWDAATLTRELSEWVRDGWNHPSVVLWDACNETIAPVLGDRVISAVRGLDRSNRAWDNGYNLPSGPDDPYEDHPYLFSRIAPGRPGFRMMELETMAHSKQSAAPHPSAHASILNEYGWLWLNRDGSPTLLTDAVWNSLLGPNATGEQRLREWAYLLGGLTEFWRSGRYHAGVLHFVYLTGSFPGVYTSDHWRDVEKLELDPDFMDYVGEAFRFLGVYLNYWQPKAKAGSERRFAISVINDEATTADGSLTLSFHTADGRELARQQQPFSVPAAGQQSYAFTSKLPDFQGECWIRATAHAVGSAAPTVSRRRVILE